MELRKDKCELCSIESMTKVDSLIKRDCVDGIEILGAAIGSDAFVSSCFLKRFKKLEQLLDNLAYVDDTRCALGILRFCLGAPKMVYSLRCNSPSDESNKILQKFDSVQRSTFESILGALLSDTSWGQACLPINKTGVGIRRSADQVRAAYVGSVFQSSVLVKKLTGHNPTTDTPFVKTVEELSKIVTTYPSQRKIQEELDSAAFDNLLGKQSSIREKARLQSLSLPQSGAWLSAAHIPALGLHLSSNEFRVALKYRLGVKLYEEEKKCPFCKSGTLDVMGDHAVSCHGRGDMISRHDRIREKFISVCSGALLVTHL